MSDMDKLSKFGEEIRRHVNEETTTKYMELARKWICSEIRMDQFDRRGQRLGVPIEVHTKFILEIGDLFNIPFEDPNNSLVKVKRKKRKHPGSSSTSNTNPAGSPTSSPLNKRTSSGLSAHLLLFALTNDINVSQNLMSTSPTSQDRAQDFVDNVLFYAGLAKTPHTISESGFIVLESPIDQSMITESDVCSALNRHNFLLPDESKRNLLVDSLGNKFHQQ